MDYDEAFNPCCNPIEASTLAQLLKSKSHPVIIVDCRFDYEFHGGHIKGAINIDSQEALEREFLHDLSKLRLLMSSRTIIVFHCEFSEKRGPGLWRTLRNLDRRINQAKCSELEEQQIFFPEMYLLERGYKNFFEKHPDLCEGTYKC